jgi:DNA excision repair protein ERCC-6
MNSIINGKRQMLFGVDILRKICNHPDLVDHKTLSKKEGFNYGSGAKSGKMQVVKALLEIWKRDGHKTLLFAQTRIMLDILEKFVKTMNGKFDYRRMDGNTNIKDRQTMVDEFNNDPDLHVFLLTTKVGGLGINLTGADRVIIFDPDWNPSVDVQARERAWRLGQKREVEIYRLMTAGTIEEKIYHRQIFKQFLSNKILRDPKQRQTFQLRDLQDLFTLGNANDSQTETGTLFQGSEVKFNDAKPAPAESNARGPPTMPTDSESLRLSKAYNGASSGSGTSTHHLEAIVGVSRQEAYAPDTAESSSDSNLPPDDSGTTKEKGDRLLSTIFARSGVHSALSHDVIVNSNTGKLKYAPDPIVIAREARKVAAEAARELQRSVEIARTIPAGIPTWTGVVGTAGRPEERPRGSTRGGFGAGRGGPSSSGVLANLSARQGSQIGRGGASSSASSSRAATPQTQPKGRDFLVLIRDFIITHGGKVYTQSLIDHFNRFCGTERRTAEFKEMLNLIAVLERGVGGRGKWTLKEEWKPKA